MRHFPRLTVDDESNSYQHGKNFLSNNDLAWIQLIDILPEVARRSDGATLMTRIQGNMIEDMNRQCAASSAASWKMIHAHQHHHHHIKPQLFSRG